MATDFPFMATDFPFMATDFPFMATDFPFMATDYPFMATGYHKRIVLQKQLQSYTYFLLYTRDTYIALT